MHVLYGLCVLWTVCLDPHVIKSMQSACKCPNVDHWYTLKRCHLIKKDWITHAEDLIMKSFSFLCEWQEYSIRDSYHTDIYSAQKKKLNGPEGAKYFFPVERSKFFLALLYYGRSSPSCPMVRRWYVESFTFYLNFPTPTPHFESCKLLKSAFTCVKKAGPPVSVQFWQKDLSHCYREKIICNSGAVKFLFLRTVIISNNVHLLDAIFWAKLEKVHY